MQECDSLSLRANAWLVIDDLDAGSPAALEHGVQVVDRKADVMDAGSAFVHEARDRRGRVTGLEKLNEGLTGAQADDARAVRIVERNFPQPQHIPKKRKALGESLDGDSNVGYASATRG